MALHRGVSSQYVLYRIYYGDCSGELFDLVPGTWYLDWTGQYVTSWNIMIDKLHFTTVLYRTNEEEKEFPSTQLLNGLPAAVLLGRYDMSIFKMIDI